MDPRFPILSSVLLSISILACGDGSHPLSPEAGQWISDIPFTYSVSGNQYTLLHDNRIYESAHFLVFSDASSDEVKRQTSRMAETAFQELIQAFGISSGAALGIVDRESRIKIYANRYNNQYLSHVFAYGIVLDAMDSPRLPSTPSYDRLLKHELMHLFQHLFGLGLNGYDDWPEVWFSEGIAEFVSGGVTPLITSQNDVNQWLAHEDHVNPISIHRFPDYPVPLSRIGEYYPMFELAVRYLLYEDGLGRRLSDVMRLYGALENGESFPNAFENHMGISVDAYQASFFDLIVEFL